MNTTTTSNIAHPAPIPEAAWIFRKATGLTRATDAEITVYDIRERSVYDHALDLLWPTLDAWLDGAGAYHDAERRAEQSAAAVAQAENSLRQRDAQLWANYSATGKMYRDLDRAAERIESGAWTPSESELAGWLYQEACNSQPLRKRRTRWDWMSS